MTFNGTVGQEKQNQWRPQGTLLPFLFENFDFCMINLRLPRRSRWNRGVKHQGCCSLGPLSSLWWASRSDEALFLHLTPCLDAYFLLHQKVQVLNISKWSSLDPCRALLRVALKRWLLNQRVSGAPLLCYPSWWIGFLQKSLQCRTLAQIWRGSSTWWLKARIGHKESEQFGYFKL